MHHTTSTHNSNETTHTYVLTHLLNNSYLDTPYHKEALVRYSGGAVEYNACKHVQLGHVAEAELISPYW